MKIYSKLVRVLNTHYQGNSINSTMELNHVFANRSDIQGDLITLTSKSRSSLHLIQGSRNLGDTKIKIKILSSIGILRNKKKCLSKCIL